MKTYKKNDWIDLIKKNLIICPYHKDELPYEYTPNENLIVTIILKHHVIIHLGPVWIAIVNILNEKYLEISYLSPLKKPKK